MNHSKGSSPQKTELLKTADNAKARIFSWKTSVFHAVEKKRLNFEEMILRKKQFLFLYRNIFDIEKEFEVQRCEINETLN